MLPGKLGAAISTLFLMASISMAVTVSVPSSTDVPQGGLVSIPVNVDNPRGIMGFQFVLTWGANNNVIEALTVTSGSLTGGWFISGNTETPGTVNIAGFSLSPLTGTASGSLCLIQFKVNGTAGQQATLNFTTSVLSDSQGQAITHTATGGNVSVVVASPATINGTINYGGTSQGTIYVGLFLDRNYNSEPVYSTSLANPGAFSISGIMSGTYYIGAFRDADGDGQYDVLTDPAGEYAGNPLAVSAGSTVNDVNIILQDPAFPATRQVSIPNNLTDGPGRVVNVPINVDEGAGVASFRFVIEYDSTVVEDTGIERGSLLPATWLVLRRQLSAGKTEITGQTLRGELVGGSGSLAIAKFQVKSTATVGQFSNLTFSDGTNNETNFLKDSGGTLINGNYNPSGPGKIEVVPGIAKGDVNGDLTVGVADAIAALRVAAGLPPGVTIYLEADVNNDGAIGVAEAIFALRVAAGLEPDPYGN